MIPYRFGVPDRQMFGVYYPPDGGRTMRRTAIVLCNPFGQEAIYSQRLFRILAERLSLAGFPVLRFDYYGTGDSDGASDEGLLDGWTLDLMSASAELMARSGCSEVAWVGLRLGASIAILASMRTDGPPHCLLLWDPVVSGLGYLHELREAHCRMFEAELNASWPEIAARLGHGPEGPTDQALGFPLAAPLRAEIEQLDLVSLGPPRVESLEVIVTSASPALDRLKATYETRAAGLTWQPFTSTSPWNSDEAMTAAIVPADVLAHVQSRLEALR